MMQRMIGLALTIGLLAGCQTMGPQSGAIRPADREPIEATPEAIDAAYNSLKASSQASANQWANRSFEEFEASVYREPGTGLYIVNGDIPISDIKHLREFFEEQVQDTVGAEPGQLILHQPGGVDASWPDHLKHALDYCVSDTFGNRHAEVVNAMASATGAWEDVANIDFTHVAGEDGNCTATNGQVLFDVRPVSGQPYLARAFFPDDVRGSRNVLINDSSFGLDPGDNLSLIGILRHELGHTLGFRHEHTRPESGTCFEDHDWRPLTNYDAFSVMHYPQCNGAGDWTLALTAADQSGVACLYGPAPGFTIDTTICTQATVPASPCGEVTVMEAGNIDQDGEVQFGPYSTLPGSKLRVVMSGQGDPDLYIRYLFPPSTNDFDCRPFLSGASETCDLTVPTGKIRAFVMVRGFSAGQFNLHITHTPDP